MESKRTICPLKWNKALCLKFLEGYQLQKQIPEGQLKQEYNNQDEDIGQNIKANTLMIY